jgi:hypothetical protein
MRLSWTEIRARAARFADDWRDASYEKGETQSFYNDFFEIFGKRRRDVARYEEHVKRLDNRSGFIDLFWPGTLIVEQKSAGRDLTAAAAQAGDYFDALPERDRPRYQLVCDFQTFELLDRDERITTRFALADLPAHVERFGFVMGLQQRTFRDQDPVNIAAAELMGRLHDRLEDGGYAGHDLERFLVRLMFCLFADDTGIFGEKDILRDYLESRTAPDGTDLGPKLNRLFHVLDTPEDRRQHALDPDLARFPYIDGALFAEYFPPPDFDGPMRDALLEAAAFDWTAISPAIFGSLFQSVMNPAERRARGAHYTTEKNILKVIEPLFLDDLRAELAHLKALRIGRRQRLAAFQQKLRSLTFLDPACGCGNFLIVAYRELRLLEMEVLRALNPRGQRELDAGILSLVDVDQFFGIEVEEFPARIAETALWMMDHIMNTRLSLEFGEVFLRIPLKAAPHIRHADALETDWADLLPPGRCSFVLGNPPFVGHQNRDKAQVEGMHRVWGRSGQYNRLDYVTCWFRKAIDYAEQNRDIGIGFVATNSITQGEQAGILWPHIFQRRWFIRFAHRTFQWNSEARGKAAVHCVIIGLSGHEPARCQVFDYEHVRGDPAMAEVPRLNGYLVNGPQWSVPARSKPRPGQLPMHKGSQPTDGARLRRRGGGYETFSNLILERQDRDRLIAQCPDAAGWIRPYVGGDELISGEWRYCLWLKDVEPQDLRRCPEVMERIARVRRGRLQSPTASVRDYADYPTLFTQDRQPDTGYVAIPEVSSETRDYIPVGFLGPEVIASNQIRIIPAATLKEFALLTSRMHMAWMRTVSGRLEMRYRYSPSVWFTFPLPDADLSPLEPLARAVLDARAAHPGATLADLYDPDLMPGGLRDAHRALDRAVDRLYRRQGFDSDRARVEHLFMLYERLVQPLTAAPPGPKRRRGRGAARPGSAGGES